MGLFVVNMPRNMEDIDTLIRTLSAYMRMKIVANEHKKHWLEESEGSLIIGLHEEKYEFLSEAIKEEVSVDDLWKEAADVCNYVLFLTDRAIRRGNDNGMQPQA